MATRSALRSKVRSRGVKLKWGESAPSFRHQLLHKRLPPAQDELQDDTRPLLIVIGGGFAGTLVCRKMTRDYHVVLIDAKEYFEYYPGICRAYADPKEHRKLSLHYQAICDAFDVEFLWGEVMSVRPDKKIVSVKTIADAEVYDDIEYDYLVVACGSQYGINLQAIQSASTGHECLWYPTCLQSSMPDSRWNTLDERFLAGRRRHIDREYNELVELNRKGATILVVGAGFVGIEFATEVKHFFSNIDIVIVEARDACIGAMPEKCIEYVKSYLARKDIKVIYNQAYKEFMSATDSIPADFSKANQSLQELAKEWGITEPSRIYMAVGLRPINSFMPAQCLSPGKRGGWININKYQEVMLGDSPVEGVFAAGNCCSYAEGSDMPAVPKNAFPGEDMASVACYNIRVLQAAKDSSSGCCFGLCRPRRKKEAHWGWGTGLCATSLGPDDATLVVGSTPERGSGFVALTGVIAALNKEFVRWSKVNQIAGGCFGGLVWKLVH